MRGLPWAGRVVAVLSFAAFVGTAGLALLPLGLLGTAAILAVRRPWPIPRGLLFLAAFLLGILLFGLFPAVPPRSAFLFNFGQTAYVVGLYLGGLLLLMLCRENTVGEQLFLIALALALTMLSGITQELFPYAAVVGVQAFFLGLFLRGFLPSGQPRPLKQELARNAVPFLLVVVVAGTLAVGFRWAESHFNLLMLSFFNPPLSGSLAFAPRTPLTAILEVQGSGRVVLRGRSTAPPAYLAGQRYARYERGTWEVLTGFTEVPPLTDPAAARPFPPGAGSLFAVRPDGPSLIDQINLVSGEPGALFLPDDTCLVAARVKGFQRDMSGGLWVRERFSGEYFVGRGKRSATPEKEGEQLLLASRRVPADLAPVVGEIARRVTRGAGSDVERVERIRNFLHREFTYGFGYPFGTGTSQGVVGDPVAEFLTRRPPAHCELFASGMVFLSRSLGIPARYVVGFLVQEENHVGGYFLARERDAHAWVEVYLPDRGWTAYDPTPPGAILPRRSEWWREWLDLAAYWKDRLKGIVWGRNLRELLLWGLEKLLALGEWLLGTPWRLGGLAAIVVAWGVLKRRRRRVRLTGGEGGGARDDPATARLVRLLREVEGTLESRGWRRPPPVTLCEWSRELGETAPANRAREQIVEFLRRYCELRYGRRAPGVEELAELEGMAAGLKGLLSRREESPGASKRE